MHTTEWTEQLGTFELDRIYGIATDSNGNVYLSGYTAGNLDTSYNTWLAKYDSHGNLLWTEQLGTSELDRIDEIATDSNGNVYLFGSTDTNIERSLYRFDERLAKYDSHGNLLWTERLGILEPGTLDWISQIATDSNGNVYLSGYTEGNLDTSSDALLAKYDSHGNLLSTEQLSTSESDVSHGVATDSNGNVYLSGSTNGNLGNLNYGGYDAWLAKYDSHGNLLWTEQLGTPEDDSSDGVVTDSNGNVYLFGQTKGNLGSLNSGSSDTWLAKYDSHGNLLWTEQLGTSESDKIRAIVPDSHGNFYLLGQTEGYLSDLNTDITDTWLAKYDPHGNLLSTEGNLGSLNFDTYNKWLEKVKDPTIPPVLTPTIDINSDLNTPIYRFQSNSKPGTYLFVGEEERLNIYKNFYDSFTEEGLGFYATTAPSDGLMPLYRFQSNAIPGTYLFVGEEEKQDIHQNFSETFNYEGIAFYIHPIGAGEETTYTRFQNSLVPGTYLYATGGEADNIRLNYPNFIEEDGAFEARI